MEEGSRGRSVWSIERPAGEADEPRSSTLRAPREERRVRRTATLPRHSHKHLWMETTHRPAHFSEPHSRISQEHRSQPRAPPLLLSRLTRVRKTIQRPPIPIQSNRCARILSWKIKFSSSSTDSFEPDTPARYLSAWNIFRIEWFNIQSILAPYLISSFSSSFPNERARTDGWKYLTLHKQRVGVIEYLAQRDTRFKHDSSSSERDRRERIFSFSSRTNPSNEIAASFHGTLSLPPFLLSFLFFFLLSLFSKKSPRRTRKEGKQEGGKKQYAVGRSRGGVQTPASPISRLVVKHRPIPRSCSVMQVLSASAAWILYRGASIYTTGWKSGSPLLYRNTRPTDSRKERSDRKAPSARPRRNRVTIVLDDAYAVYARSSQSRGGSLAELSMEMRILLRPSFQFSRILPENIPRRSIGWRGETISVDF